MTFFEKLSNWKKAIEGMNTQFNELENQRDECYKWLANAIKTRFEREDIPVPKIYFEPDASRIVCSWDSVDQDNIRVPFEMILDLKMDFTFDKILGDDGFWRKTLILYPFGAEKN